MRSLAAVLSILAFAAATLHARAQADGGLVQGRLIDAVSHRALGGVQMQLSSPGNVQTALTNSRGEFVFFGVPDGHYQLTEAAAGYTQCEVPDFEINAGERWRIEMRVQPHCLAVAGVHLTQLRSAGYTSDVYIVH
ncbi:MAG: carboxypeptidase-like regulatory domain-containing protein [Candidatus Baltobacteraceae bacterium]